MKSLLKKIFLDNWLRKILSFILALITWIFINHSLSITKIIHDVPIRVINLPKDKAIKGMQSDGLLLDTMPLEIQGNKNLLDRITKSDLEILVDLKDNKKEDYKTLITKNNIVSKNSTINIERTIKKLKHQELSIQLSKFVIEKIPLIVTQPIGEAPKGYQFLDLWPYTLYVTVSGPEDIIKNLKVTGLKLTFNLNSISESELDAIDSSRKRGNREVVSYFVPTAWKKINVPDISVSPIDVDDPNAKALRIDFIKKDFIPIISPIPIVLFFPSKTSDKLNPSKISVANSEYIKKINGIDMISIPLYVQGASQAFVDTINENIFILIVVEPKEDKEKLEWNLQPIFPKDLEKIFIKKIINQKTNDEALDLQPHITEEYLKVRFRSYLNKFRLWVSPTEKFNLKISLENNKVYIIPETK